jgi:hypothetical protein
MASAGGLRKSLGLFGTIAAAGVWSIATVWLGLIGVIRAVKFVGPVRRSFATTLRCPRGHPVELYGTFRCPRCKAVREGRAFDPCGICGSRSTHLDCVRCGLAVRDPLL